MAPDFRPIVLIPVYDHERCLNDIVTSLRQKGLPVLLADDASHAACAREIRCIAAGTDGVFSVHHAVNGGKGAAVVTGFEVASDLGFTHVLQIDADGQHDLKAIDDFLSAGRAAPTHSSAAFRFTTPPYRRRVSKVDRFPTGGYTSIPYLQPSRTLSAVFGCTPCRPFCRF